MRIENYKYTVSVRLMTYMHENFIAKAMNGILMQKTDFNVEVLVGDDFSTDKTLEIIKNYKNSENIDIKILERRKGDAYDRQRQKQGRLFNFVDILNNCNGKYVALLDGDDYWTDPLKLQKQVDFLENNKNHAAVFTDVNTLKEGLITNNALKEKHKKTVTKENIVDGFWIPTLTILFKTEAIKNKLPEFYNQAPNGDVFLFYIIAQHGFIGYLNEVTGVYRQHDGGVWVGTKYTKQIDAHIKTFQLLSKHFKNNSVYNKNFKNIILTNQWQKFKFYKKKRSYINMFKTLGTLFINNPIFTLKLILKVD